MKKKFITMAVAIISVFTASLPAKAFDLKDILGGNGGGIVGNLLEGVFTKTDLTTKDLMGVWTTDKPAVSFKSEDMLKKAGGMAAAAALETKLTPYFEQFGLNGATLTVNADSTFSLKSKRLNLSGTISQRNDGIFLFNIKAFGKISLGEIPAYVQKTSKSMEVMFDSSKLKSIAHTIAKFIDIKSLSTLTGLLDSYDGMYVGFGMDKTGMPTTTNNPDKTRPTAQQDPSSETSFPAPKRSKSQTTPKAKDAAIQNEWPHHLL